MARGCKSCHILKHHTSLLCTHRQAAHRIPRLHPLPSITTTIMPIISNDTLCEAVNLVSHGKSVVKPPLSNTAFTLDSSGVAGFFGGESAVRAMATVNLLPKRRWCGWYNAPGSYEVAKQYGPLAMSDIFDGLFPARERDPAKILMVDGESGSRYIPVHSPTASLSHIGHLGYLLERKAGQMPITKIFGRVKGERHTMDVRVTLVRLNHMPDEFDQLKTIRSSSITFALGTVLISIGGCIACAFIADWFCFASIALGIIANGVACSVIGSGKLTLKHNIPAQVESPGDIVLRGDTEIFLLIGSEGAVSPFTRAHFVLQYYGKPEFQPEQDERDERTNSGRAEDEGAPEEQTCRRCKGPIITCKMCRRSIDNRTCWPQIQQEQLVRASVILLLSQFLAQLLLIPQGTLFGQLMFLATLVPSWMYHSYLSSLSVEFQTQTLFDKLRIKEGEDIHRYQLNTWTEAVVFTCLTLASIRHKSYHDPETDKFKKNIEGLLDGLLQSKTDVWQTWKEWLAEKMVECADLEHEGKRLPSQLYSKDEKAGKCGSLRKKWQEADLRQLRMYQEDANRALEAWITVRDNKEMRSLRYTARDGHS